MRKRDAIDISYSEWEHLIDEWVLSARDRRIAKESILDDISYAKIAEKYDLSDRAVQNIIDKALYKISKHI